MASARPPSNNVYNSATAAVSNCESIISGHAIHFAKDVPITGTVYGTLLNDKDTYNMLEPQMTELPYKKPPTGPILYIKPRNTYNRNKGIIPLPSGVKQVTIGASLGIVIGRTAVSVNEENAMEYIEGYTIVNDVSLKHDSFYRPPIRFNARDGFCPIGPDIKKANLISNPESLKITVSINNEVVQVNSTSELIRPIPTLIKDVTEFMTLYPGDVLMVGVPGNPPVAKDGDKVSIEINQIGCLDNEILSEDLIEQGGK